VAICDAIISRKKKKKINQIKSAMNVWGIVTSKYVIIIYWPRKREEMRK
jgi:hypothetical protein